MCPTASRKDAPRELLGLRVAIVEDEYFVADTMKVGLELAGASVVAMVPTVDEGLRLFSRGDQLVDAAVLDINLQGARSYALADLLDQHAVPFVFVTGYDSGGVDDRYKSRPRCMKPLDIGELCTALAKLCDRGF